MAACDGTLVSGEESLLSQETTGVVVAAMTLPHVLDRLFDGAVVVTPGRPARGRARRAHRPGVARTSRRWPGSCSTAASTLPEQVTPADRRARHHHADRRHRRSDTSDTTAGADVGARPAPEGLAAQGGHRARAVRGARRPRRCCSTGSRSRARDAVTPLMFEHQLIDMAVGDRRHIVLPEGDDDRILQAADTLLRRKVADLTILGEPREIQQRAALLGVDLSAARLLSPIDPELRGAVRRGVPRTPQAQGHRPRAGPRHRHRRVLLRHDDGRARPRRRHGLRRRAHHRPHDPAGARGGAHGARRLGRVVGVLHVPARPGARLRRLRGQPRPDRRPARRHRAGLGAHGRGVRGRAARGDAVLLDRRLGLGHRRRQGHRGDRDGARARARRCWSRARSSTTPRSTPPSRAPSCRARRSPGGRPSSSSRTSTRATTPTRRCSARPARSRSARSCRACASR